MGATPLKIACLGECMIELRHHAPGLLAQGYAGDTYNTAVYLKRLDVSARLDVQYASGLGGDPFADEMLEAWRAEGIGEELVRRIPERTTGLYAIRTDRTGERHFSYWREQSAARVYLEGTPSPLESRPGSIELLYLSGITLAVMASALERRLPVLLERIRRAGGRIAFDNNYRARLWPSPQAARAAFEMLYRHADIALVTLDDEAAIDPSRDAETHLARVLALDCREVVVKRGERSTLVREAGRTAVEVPVQPVTRVVDTTGAGDSFAAGYLWRRLADAPVEEAVALGNRLAGLVIQHPGAIVPPTAMADLLAAERAGAAR